VTFADDATPTRGQASEVLDPLGWRLVLGAARTQIRRPTLAASAEAAVLAAAAAGAEGDGHLTADLRADRILLRLQTAHTGTVTGLDLRLARRVSAALAERSLHTEPDDGGVAVQALEIAIDALDIPAVRPFWQAVTGYADGPGAADANRALVDPLGRGPTIWFQQMDAPRPQRNRIHLDVDVAPEQARARIDATLAAGGVLRDDTAAPAFWVLADPEGNEACVCTWQGRD
jgi:4a-hydroxytetrahydrobiopterin dehydratase